MQQDITNEKIEEDTKVDILKNFASLCLPLIVYDINGCPIYASDSAIQLFSHDGGQEVFDINHICALNAGSSKEQWQKYIEALREGKHISEKCYSFPDGKIITCKEHLELAGTENGTCIYRIILQHTFYRPQPVFTSETSVDLYTSTIHTGFNLEQEREWKSLISRIPGFIFLKVNKDMRYVEASGLGLELLGFHKDKLEGGLLNEQDLNDTLLTKAIEDAMTGNSTVFETEYPGDHFYQWSISPLYNAKGEICAAMAAGINLDDICRTKKTHSDAIKELRQKNHQLKIENGVRQLIQKNLQEQTKELEQKNQELEQFAYVASHDLQEPLRMVSSYTQLLANRYKDSLDSNAEEFVNYAVEGASRMQQLINDLLSYSRVGRKEMSFEKINLEVVLQIVQRNLQLLVEETGADIKYADLPFINGDASQLVQLFQNLISNAVKFRKDDVKPVIHIESEIQENHLILKVRDNGIGMNMEYKDRIFQIFQRLHTRDKYPGTGIGLAICKKIVERHGGRIWIESELGMGTSFVMEFSLEGAKA